MKNTITLSIFAEALVDNREYKNARINGDAVGVANARKWLATVKSMRIPAYAVRVHRYNHMGVDEADVPVCNMTPLFNTLKEVLDLVGEVNGAKLNTSCIAEEIISNAMKFRVIDITNEMAKARCDYRTARKNYVEDESEENAEALDLAKAEVARLEGEAGNCKRIAEIQSESAFVKAVEIILGDAIKKQCLKSAEEVAAEEEARKAEKRARHKAKKAEKAKAEVEAKANA